MFNKDSREGTLSVKTATLQYLLTDPTNLSQTPALTCLCCDGARDGVSPLEWLLHPLSLLLFVFLYMTEVTFPVHRQQSARKRMGMEAQMGSLLMLIYRTVESNTYMYLYLFFSLLDTHSCT